MLSRRHGGQYKYLLFLLVTILSSVNINYKYNYLIIIDGIKEPIVSYSVSVHF